MPVNAIVARLEGSTSVTSIASTRIYPSRLPQDPAFPAVLVELVSESRDSYMVSDDGDVTARVQTTSYAKTFSSAWNLRQGIRAATQRWSGTSTGVVVDEIFIEDGATDYDDVTGDHAHTLDLIVHYKE